MAATGAQVTYYRTLTLSGHPVAVVRRYDGLEDDRSDPCRDGQWVMTNHNASIVLLGEIDADEISEDEAMAAAEGSNQGDSP